MAVQQPSLKKKKHSIEPLNFAAMADAPAMKGMISFLEISAESIRNGDYKDVVTSAWTHTRHETNHAAETPRLVEFVEARPEKSRNRHQSTGREETSHKVITNSAPPGIDGPTGVKQNRLPAPTGAAAPTDFGRRVAPVFAAPPGSNGSSSLLSPFTGADPVRIREENLAPREGAIHGYEGVFEESSFKNVDRLEGPEREPRGDKDYSQANTRRSSVSNYAGYQPAVTVLSQHASQNRKVRRCVLAQDGHTKAENQIYDVLWNSKTAIVDPDAPSRAKLVRMGYMELSKKALVDKKTAKQNIATLIAKLTIEVAEDYDSQTMTSRLYRVFNYPIVLERRAKAGLTHVIRDRRVSFTTPQGDPIKFEGLYNESDRKRRVSASHKIIITHRDSESSKVSSGQAEVDRISLALNKYWPVDSAAADQLLNSCRRVRRDAEIEEILFFIDEKAVMARRNKSIANPTGLLLTIIPQCFEGDTFEQFRHRRKEAIRLRDEEELRRREQNSVIAAMIQREMQAVLENPESSDADKARARKMLRI